MFALWLASGYELVRSIRAAEAQMASARHAFIHGQQVLATITTHVMLGSIYLRDTLMNPTAEMRAYYRRELNRLHTEVDRALPEYEPLVDTPMERQQWAELQVELANYWNSREVAFATQEQDDATARTASAAVIQSRLVPARESILEIINSLVALERASVESHEGEAAQFYGRAEARVVMLASLALVAAVLVAWVAGRHVTRLQREIERQQRAEHQNRLDLERLSARLVMAQEHERRSLSRELHDAVGQALTAIKMEMGIALRGGATDARARMALEQARAIAETTLQNVRDLSQLLHPSMLDDFGLPEALNAYLRSFSRRASVRAQLTHERMEDRLPADIEVCVYRIVQEAMTNVARHSGASSCTVSLIRRDDVLHLTIEDDGRGIGPTIVRTPADRRGLGLIGMRERAQALSGSFAIENRSEGGTRVTVRIPLPEVSESNTEPRQLAAG